MGIHIQILLTLFNGDFSRLDTTGYLHWYIQGNGIIIRDSLPVFVSDGRYSFISQTVENISSPWVSIRLLDRCPDMYVKAVISGFAGKERISRRARSRDSLGVQELSLSIDGEFDSVSIRISAHSRFRTGCRIPLLSMNSNFLKNMDFGEYSVFPSGWGGRGVDYAGGVRFGKKGIIGRYIEFKYGTVYRIRLEGSGDFVLRLNYIKRKRRFEISDSGSVLDTVPSFNGRALLTVESSGGFLRRLNIEILDTLPLVVNRTRGGIYIRSNLKGMETIYIYDSNGNVIRRMRMGEGDFSYIRLKRGEYLILVPRKFRKRIYVR